MSISKRRNHIVKLVSVRLIVAPQCHLRGPGAVGPCMIGRSLVDLVHAQRHAASSTHHPGLPSEAGGGRAAAPSRRSAAIQARPSSQWYPRSWHRLRVGLEPEPCPFQASPSLQATRQSEPLAVVRATCVRVMSSPPTRLPTPAHSIIARC